MDDAHKSQNGCEMQGRDRDDGLNQGQAVATRRIVCPLNSSP
jgi:hypothetical protein